jgi:hypothetical protein
VGTALERLESWVEKQLRDHAVAFEVAQHSETGAHKVGETTAAKDTDPRVLASNILGMCQDDASGGFQGQTRYAVKSYRKGEGGRSYMGRTWVTIEGRENDDIRETEGPTPPGQISQLQRHLEVVHKTSVLSMGGVIKAYEKILALTLDRVKTLEKGYLDTIIAKEEILNVQTERNLLTAKEQNVERRKDEALGSFMKYVPRLVEVGMSKLLPPNDAINMAGQGVACWLAELPDAQVQAFAQSGMIPPDQMAMLLEARKIVKDNLGKLDAEREARERAKNGKPATP